MKTVFVTGIGRGIGRAIAERALCDGYSVIGTTQTGATDLKHGALKALKLDLSSKDSIQACVAAAVAARAKIDMLINNAGVLLDYDAIHLDTALLRQTLEINLIGTADLTESLLPLMNKDSHIVFLSSQAGSITEMDHVEDSHFPYHYPAYKISKAALNMYMRTLAARLAHEGSGIIASSVHPGWVRTDMGRSEAPVLPEEAAADILELAASRPSTGQFWFKGKNHPW